MVGSSLTETVDRYIGWDHDRGEYKTWATFDPNRDEGTI